MRGIRSFKTTEAMKELAKKIINGDCHAIAKGITLVENENSEAWELMKALFPSTGKSMVVGITGASGTGKSTLVDRLAAGYRKRKKKIGILAIDPSSPFTGGALLGDRIRMMRLSTDPDAFTRSMATRGQLGGLARAAGGAVEILEAAGKEVVLIETVGIGQDEVEVARLADVTLVVLTPDSGDDIQAFKAGVMEIADIFVLNKSDNPEATKLEGQIQALLGLVEKKEIIPRIIKTIAIQDVGTERLIEAIDVFLSSRDDERRERRRRRQTVDRLTAILRDMFFVKINKQLEGGKFEAVIENIQDRRLDPYTAAEDIWIRIQEQVHDKKD